MFYAFPANSRGFLHTFSGWVDDIAPVQIAALQAMDEYLGRGDIGRDGDIVYVAQAQQIHFIGLMGLRADRVSEEEQQVDLVAGDARSDLLVAPMGAGQKTAGCAGPWPPPASLPVVPVAHRSCWESTRQYAIQNCTISSFLESCAINAMFIWASSSYLSNHERRILSAQACGNGAQRQTGPARRSQRRACRARFFVFRC